MGAEIARPTITIRPLHRRFLPRANADPDAARGLYPGEPETCRRSLRRFLPVWGQLALLLAVVKTYRLEGRALEILATVALLALPVHYLLPFRWKKPFFIAASIGGMTWVFGPSVAATILLAATALIGVCYLPISWTARAAIVGTLALGLALVRVGWAAMPAPDLVWPVLGSMFMFRMLIYLYELKHARGSEPIVDTIGYFFLLPNYCFMHFPVVDYRTYRRGYFAEDLAAIQWRGLRMMVNGVLHLLAYRLIDHGIMLNGRQYDLLIPMGDVAGPATLLQFLICNYLLYLRVSGQFHIACGMLHLFGHQLPETHHHYLLASSFTDYWRRINIYWKDFMVRVVFNPVVFRLKRRPQALALAVATVIVFVVTWALHAYQSFWLRGSWSFGLPDALFWGILGALVLVNVQLDARTTRHRKGRGAVPRSGRDLLIRASKTLGTFATIAVLWSLWSSPTLGQWLGMLGRAWPGHGTN